MGRLLVSFASGCSTSNRGARCAMLLPPSCYQDGLGRHKKTQMPSQTLPRCNFQSLPTDQWCRTTEKSENHFQKLLRYSRAGFSCQEHDIHENIDGFEWARVSQWISVTHPKNVHAIVVTVRPIRTESNIRSGSPAGKKGRLWPRVS